MNNLVPESNTTVLSQRASMWSEKDKLFPFWGGVSVFAILGHTCVFYLVVCAFAILISHCRQCGISIVYIGTYRF